MDGCHKELKGAIVSLSQNPATIFTDLVLFPEIFPCIF